MKKVSVYIFLGLGLLLLLCLIVILTLIGRMPILSDIIWKQKDLGQVPNAQLVEDVYKEIGFENNIKTSSGEITVEDFVYSGTVDLERDFTSEELTAIVNSWNDEWPLMPLSNIQVRITGNTVELSAIASIQKVKDFARSINYSEADINKVDSYIGVINDEVPIYAKFTGSVTKNVFTINLQEVSAGVIGIPSGSEAAIGNYLEDVLQRRRAQIEGLYIESATVSDGKLRFEGTIPGSVGLGE